MAEICLLPAPEGDAETRRHLQALKAALAQGLDLGSRGPHIQTLGHALAAKLTELEQECETFSRRMGPDGGEMLAVLTLTRGLVLQLQTLARLSQTYPN